jgi:hypothetical protein
MSLDVTGLSAYTEENLMPLIKKSVLEGKTSKIISVQPGIKSSATINTLSSTLLASAGACGWSASGSTALGQETITVSDIKINESICLNTLEGYYTQTLMRPGSYNEEIPFEQLFAEEKADQVQALVEDILWQGDTAGSGNLALADGLIKNVSASVAGGSGVDSAYSGSLTPSNAIDAVDDMVDKVPTDVIGAEDLTLFMGHDSYRTYAKALRDANLFHYDGKEGADFEMMVPGTNVKAVAVRGLNGQDKMYLTPASNFYLGTDLLEDAEAFKIWYSQDNDEVRFLAKWKQGVGVAFPDFVVQHK